MKYILAILCFIVSICFNIKPDFMSYDVNVIFGLIFMLLGNLFLNYKREDR